MTKLFGVPVGSLTAVLGAALAVALGTVAVLALRNRVFFRLGVRNVVRRPARSALIVAGSMLGTAIIAAALTTGDTMSHTIRASSITALGQTDEVVAAKGMEAALDIGTSGATGAQWIRARDADRIAAAARRTGLVDAVAPVIAEPVAVLDAARRQSEPSVTLFASDPAALRGFGTMRGAGGAARSLVDLRPGEVYLNAKAAEKLDARAGDVVRILAGRSAQTARVRDVVRYEGGATSGAGVLEPLAAAQRLLGRPGLVRAVFVSNNGDDQSGAKLSDRVIARLAPMLGPLGLEADRTKQKALDDADTMGAAFMSMFTTFGMFSIAAGILLIFLIVVMLAAERRSELGIARAVGTQRRHLVQVFLFEGVAYDVLAAAAGALLGVIVAFLMVRALASAFSSEFDISFAVRPTSLVLAYAIGVLLTLAVVAGSARRVSRMNIVTAIRNLPEPPPDRRARRRWIAGLAGIALGALLAVSGIGAKDAMTLSLGVLVAVLSLVPVVRALGVADRVVYTSAGLALVAWFVLPIERWLFGDMKVNFSIFVLSGLAIVVGATWAIMYNADVLLGALASALGRSRRLAPVLRMSMAYPLRSVFRTGVTLAMFTLVVFTLVVGAITTGSFLNGFNDVDKFGGGFQVIGQTSPATPVRDLRAAMAASPSRQLRAAGIRVVSDESVLPVTARQTGLRAAAENYIVHGVDRAFLDHTTYGLAGTARGYGSAADVWRAVRDRPDLAVIDPLVVPRRSNWGFGPMPDFKLRGFYLEDRTFTAPVVVVRDPQTGRRLRLTVIGVLSDTAPQSMTGLWTSQASLSRVFGDRVVPTVHRLALAPGADATATAKALESAFLANGMQADSLRKLLDDNVGQSLTFDRLIEGFMALGLIVGVAALGVISTRSVVERRQQIGVLRAIGFRRRMVQMSFLLESGFIVLSAIVIGTVLGIAVAWNVVADARRTPSWESMSFHVPWATLALVFAVVALVALLATFFPARRASRVYPAEALRYE